jgi:hypothetical protein
MSESTMLSRTYARLMMATLAVAVAIPLWGQGELVNARLSGMVRDPNEAVVPGALVTLANPQTGFSRRSVTGIDGWYVFTLVPPGQYQLKVEKEGFRTCVQADIVLTVGQSSSLEVKLEIGAFNQTVEVVARAPLLNTGNVDIGGEVSGKQIVELPLNTRNVYGLVALSSSVNSGQTVQGFT